MTSSKRSTSSPPATSPAESLRPYEKWIWIGTAGFLLLSLPAFIAGTWLPAYTSGHFLEAAVSAAGYILLVISAPLIVLGGLRFLIALFWMRGQKSRDASAPSFWAGSKRHIAMLVAGLAAFGLSKFLISLIR